MAELISLVEFTLMSCISLYQAVESFRDNPRAIRELKDELEALTGVLRALQVAAANNSADLKGLNLPLYHCGRACEGFEVVIIKCTVHSGGSRTSFRDWAKLKYKGDDIIGFKNMLAGYKSTMSIALLDAIFRRTAVTTDLLKEYKERVTNMTSDLKERLQELGDKLQTLLQGTRMSDEDAAERDEVQEKKDSTEQCLTICAQALACVDTAGVGTIQCPGQMSDGLQQFLWDLVHTTAAGVGAVQSLGQMPHDLLQQFLRNLDNAITTGAEVIQCVEQTSGAVIQEFTRNLDNAITIGAEAIQCVEQTSDAVIQESTGNLDNAITTGAEAIQCVEQTSGAVIQEFTRNLDNAIITGAEAIQCVEQTTGAIIQQFLPFRF